jgi:hypothetical protein
VAAIRRKTENTGGPSKQHNQVRLAGRRAASIKPQSAIKINGKLRKSGEEGAAAKT